jgi:hypothetical protein
MTRPTLRPLTRVTISPGTHEHETVNKLGGLDHTVFLRCARKRVSGFSIDPSHAPSRSMLIAGHPRMEV